MDDRTIRLVDYDAPQFWEPANALGKAATVRGTVNGGPIILNFYWSGMSLTFRSDDRKDETALCREVTDFIKAYQPKEDDDQVQHFMHDDEGFRRIADPHWNEGHR